MTSGSLQSLFVLKVEAQLLPWLSHLCLQVDPLADTHLTPLLIVLYMIMNTLR